MRGRLLAALVLAGAPALAEGVPPVRVPDGPVVVIETLLPTLRAAGTGHVRLVHGPDGVAARLDVNEFYAYEDAYCRHLLRLLMRMPFAQAEPIARRAAFEDIVGPNPPTVGTIRSIPRS